MSVKKFHLDCQYVIKRFTHHAEIKNELLRLIEEADSNHVVEPEAETDIAKVDWFKASDFSSRNWFEYIKQYLIPDVTEMCRSVGFDGFKLWEIWFQQYFKTNGHGWHTHSANWTSVYYLELPPDAPKTQIVNPFTQNIIEVNIKEGDILMFPSFILHRAPPIPNESSIRKTIISYNIDTLYSTDIYGQGVKNT